MVPENMSSALWKKSGNKKYYLTVGLCGPASLCRHADQWYSHSCSNSSHDETKHLHHPYPTWEGILIEKWIIYLRNRTLLVREFDRLLFIYVMYREAVIFKPMGTF